MISLSQLSFSAALALVVCSATVPALETQAQDLTTASPSRWRFGVGYAPMIGLRTEFSGFGNFQAGPPLPAGGAGTYTYLDGFVGVDSSGNLGNVTTFFSVNSAAQYDPAGFGGQGSLTYTALTSGLSQSGHIEEAGLAAAGGFDLYGYLQAGVLNIPLAAGVTRQATWGWRVGAQYARVDETNRDTISGGVGTQTDVFNLGGSFVPGYPYTGPFAGFGPTISEAPGIRTPGGANATISGSRNLDVHLLVSQFGTYAEIPLTEKLDLMVEGGAILALAHGSYRYETSVTVPGAGTQTSNGYETRTRLLPGLYIGLGLLYNITENFGIQAAGRYQYMSSFDINANGSTASLSFQSAFTVSLSAVYSF